MEDIGSKALTAVSGFLLWGVRSCLFTLLIPFNDFHSEISLVFTLISPAYNDVWQLQHQTAQL